MCVGSNKLLRVVYGSQTLFRATWQQSAKKTQS